MSKHPFSNHLQCHKAVVERVSISQENPDGWRWLQPCLCPAFQRLQHTITEGAENGQIVRRQVEVTGCLYTLFAWMQGGATAQANTAVGEVVALRRDIQEIEKSMRGVILSPLMESLGLSSGMEKRVIAERSETQ